jgi:hypothetical protein
LIRFVRTIIRHGYPFIHSVVCFTTGPKPLQKRARHVVRSRASSFKWEHPLLSLWSSSSFLRLLPRLSVTSIPPFIFPSITRCRRQFLRKMWPIPLLLRKFKFVITFETLNFSVSKISLIECRRCNYVFKTFVIKVVDGSDEQRHEANCCIILKWFVSLHT